MVALSRAGLIPALRGLGTAAFRVVGTWTAEPGRLYDPGCRHYSFEQATGGVLAHGEDFYAGSVSAMLQPALRQRYSRLPATVQCVFGAQGARLGLARNPTTTVDGLESRQRCSPRVGLQAFPSYNGLELPQHHRNTVPPASTMKAPCSTEYAEHRYQLRGIAVPTTPNRQVSRMGLGRS